MTEVTEQRWGSDLVEELRRRNGKSNPLRATGHTPSRSSRPGQSRPGPQGRPAPTPEIAAQGLEGELASDRPSDQQRAKQDLARAGQMLERARWASRAYATYSKEDVDRVVRAVVEVAESKAHQYAEWAVRETGFGVVADKVRKNLACSVGVLDEYAGDDYVTPRVVDGAKLIEVPRPAGVVLALTPSTNPVATTYFKVILALMTRNAVVVSPHPMAKGVCADAARAMAEAAEAAGAPAGVVQCVENPTIPLVESLMGDERVNVVVATGGPGVVRAAYASGTPALGVGPGNVPVFVDATADLRAAATAIVDSKAFDNSVLCTNESVLIVENAVADKLLAEMQNVGAQLLTPDEADRLAAHMYPGGRLNTDVVGRDASVIAAAAGIKSGPRTRVLLAPFDAPLPERVMSHEKLSPVLGVLRVPDARRGIAAAASIIRVAGAGHSAAIHSTDPQTVMDYTTAVPVLRVSVNVGNSTGSSGLDTHLAPTMTIGTGFVGGSSIGDNLEPGHLVNWARIAYGRDVDAPMGDYRDVAYTAPHSDAVPPYPWASNDPRSGGTPSVQAGAVVNRVAASLGRTAVNSAGESEALKEEIRRLVAAELSKMLKG